MTLKDVIKRLDDEMRDVVKEISSDMEKVKKDIREGEAKRMIDAQVISLAFGKLLEHLSNEFGQPSTSEGFLMFMNSLTSGRTIEEDEVMDEDCDNIRLIASILKRE